MSPRWRVLITDRAWPDCEIERRLLAQVDGEVIDAPAGDEATLVKLAAGVHAIATNWAKVTPAVLDAARGCRVVSRFGIGVDNIDVATCTARRIIVTNCPDYCLAEVSDHTLGLLLACARQIGFFHHRMKQGEYQLSAGRPMHRLSEQTVGLIGLGQIGQALVPKVRALGLRVIAHTPSGNDHGTGCEMVSLPSLLERSDYVSLHLPLTPATHHLLGSAEFQQMRRTAYVINTSRGGLIDPTALWQALERDEVAGAALDVYEPEPPDLQHPLYHHEQVITTPHAAFVSIESVRHMRQQAIEQIIEVLNGQTPKNVVNRAVLH